MKAVKGNKEYMIDESQKKTYQDRGYDIKDSDGKVIAYGRGKTVPYDKHMEAVREIERLQGLLLERNTEIEKLQKNQEQVKKTESKKTEE